MEYLNLIKNLFLQAIVFILIFNGFSWLRESSMLSGGSQLTDSPVLSTIDDKQVELKAENKKTLIYFFAPWCTVCHASIDNLQDIYMKNQDVDVIAVALDFVDQHEVDEFVAKHDLTFPIAIGNERVKKEFKIKGYPSYYVLNEENQITGRSLGYSSEIGMYLRLL